MSDENKKHTITMEFDDDETLMAFAYWLCDSGEQYLMDDLENSDDGPVIRGLSYHKEHPEFAKDDRRRYGPFMAERVIKVFTRKEEEK